MRIFLALLVSLFAISAPAQESKLDQLEDRIQALEEQLDNKLEHCELTFIKWTHVTRICPNKTFVYGSFLVSSTGPIQLDCGYYQLRCQKRTANGELITEQVPLELNSETFLSPQLNR